jgi:pimeloyl-[acyl-carrier protein] methyl ester esterase
MQIVTRAEQAAAIQLYEMMYGLDLRPRLPTITLPTLIIHGEKDALVPVSAAQWLAGQLPHSQLHILPGAGHVPTMTRPQQVATLINQFFAPAV